MNYYDILEVSSKASVEVINMAYKALAKKYHPDIYRGDKKVAEELMKSINEAYSIISDPNKRLCYDELINLENYSTNLSSANKRNSNETKSSQYSNSNKEKYNSDSNKNENYANSSDNKDINDTKNVSIREVLIKLFLIIPYPIKKLMIIFVLVVIYFGVMEIDSIFNSDKSISSNSKNNAPLMNQSNSTGTTNQQLKNATFVPIQELPANGVITNFTNKKVEAPFKIVAPEGVNYYILLKNVSTKEPEVSIFVRNGTEVEVEVPLGKYEMYCASGKLWYGTKNHFGNETMYSKANDTFDFYIDGDYIIGNTVELILQTNGNLSTSYIDSSEFNN